MPLSRRRTLAGLVVLALLCARPALAQDGAGNVAPTIPLDAPPSAVTVYPDQATVTRTGSVDLPAGDSLLVLGNIPAGVLRDSVTAAGRAAAPVSIGAVEVRQVSFDPRATGTRRAELETRLSAVDDEIAAVDVRITALAAQLSLIERLGNGLADAPRRPASKSEPRATVDPSQWRSAWESVRDGTAEAGEATRVARSARRDLEAQRTTIQAEVAALGTPAAGALEIAVAVRAEAQTRLEISVGYQLPGARWQPVYEARLDTAAARLALRQEALVTQQTGEDWRDVTLTLSTARPAAEARPPELRPWRISLFDSAREVLRQREGVMALPAPAPVPAQAPRTVAAPLPPVVQAAEAVTATLATAGFAVEYRIPGRATVRADGTERRVRIGDMPAEATLAVRTVPRLDPRAFLEARFASPFPVATLPGRTALYLDGVLVGRAALPVLRPGEEFTLPFGADDRVRVAYLPQAARRGAEGTLLTGRTSTRTTEALITLQSFHNRPIEVTALDQLPVSGDDLLVVVLIADPPPTARNPDDRPGVVGWTATLAPREERRIRFGYTVTAPRDREVLGLDR